VEFRSRVLVFVQWAIQDLTFARGARLITGSDTLPPVPGENRPARSEENATVAK